MLCPVFGQFPDFVLLCCMYCDSIWFMYCSCAFVLNVNMSHTISNRIIKEKVMSSNHIHHIWLKYNNVWSVYSIPFMSGRFVCKATIPFLLDITMYF